MQAEITENKKDLSTRITVKPLTSICLIFKELDMWRYGQMIMMTCVQWNITEQECNELNDKNHVLSLAVTNEKV